MRRSRASDAVEMVTVNERSSADLGGDIDFRRLLQTLYQQKYLSAGIVVLCAVTAAVVALLTEPVYRADAVAVAVNNQNASTTSSLVDQLGGLASIAGLRVGADENLRESRAILESRHLAEEFITRYDLMSELLPTARTPTLWLAARRLKSKVVSISDNTRAGTITITVEWTDAEVAARWANQFLALANEIIRTRAIDYANRNVLYLQEQVQKTNLVEIQRALYNLIENETKTLMLATARAEYAFTTVDPAVKPEIRVRPQRTMMVAFGSVLGVLAAIVLAFSRMMLASRR
jgi:uncharacterized protein involved in exopolysaccharide biosynthesis